MVEIKIGDDLLFSSTLQHLKYVVLDICLRKELNQADTLELVVPDINVRKSLLQAGRKEITMWVNGRRRFRGRLITKGMDFDKSIRVYCEGELAYLRDVIVRKYTSSNKTVAQYFEDMINGYNVILGAADPTNHTSDYKKFTKGNVTVTGETTTRGNEDFPTYLDELTEQLLNQYGGYLIPRYENGYEYLDYVTDEGNGNQTIVYGKNLLDYKKDEDYSVRFNRVIALGGTPESGGGIPEIEGNGEIEENTEIPSPSENEVANNEEVIVGDNVESSSSDRIWGIASNNTSIRNYGLLEKVISYDEVTDYETLEEKAEADVANGFDVTPTLEIAAVDMQNFDGSEPFEIGKKYRLIFPAQGYTESSDKVLLVSMEEYPLQLDRSIYTFGAVKSGITYQAVQTNRAMNAVAKLAVNTAADAKKLLEQIQELSGNIEGLSNYVTAEETANNWHIRTWNNGNIEAWTHQTITGISFSSGVASKSISIPTGFAQTSVVEINCNELAICYGVVNNNNLDITIWADNIFTSADFNIRISKT